MIAASALRAFSIAGALCLAAGLAAAQEAAPAPTPATPTADTAPDPNLVVAKIGEMPVTRGEVLDSIRDLRDEQKQVLLGNLEKYFPQMLERYIFLKLAAAKGKAAGLAEDAEVKAAVAAFADDEIRRAWFEREVKARVTDAAVKERYDELAKTGAFREVSARHILVASEEEAKAIIAELQAGADFATLAKEKSTDKGSAAQGGDLGWFMKRMMVKPFADAAFAMEKGAVSAAPVKTQFGWHVIKLEDKRERGFDDVKDEIRQALIEEARNAIAQDLRQEAKVEVIDASGGLKPAE